MRTNVLLLTAAVICVAVTGSENNRDGEEHDWRIENVTTKKGLLSSSQWLLKDDRKSSEFPDDLFTDYQLRHGAAVLHFIGALYSFAMIGIVCGNYFLPSVDCICLGLNLSQDVAAATFMSFATTAPELFTVLIGTFITESDVGLGAVIGSGMFNILGVATFGGLAAIKPIQLEWWPLIRDSTIYLLALTALFSVIHDRRIGLTGAAFLFSCYFVYFFIMFSNQRLKKYVKTLIGKVRKKSFAKSVGEVNQQKAVPDIMISSEVPPIGFQDDSPPVFVKDGKNDRSIDSVRHRQYPESVFAETDIGNFEDDISYRAYFIHCDKRSLSRKSIKSERGSVTCKSVSDLEGKESVRVTSLELTIGDKGNGDNGTFPFYPPPKDQEKSEAEPNGEEEFSGVNLTRIPDKSMLGIVVWLLLWPGSFLLYVTVPDCRVMRWRKYYPLTFLMCIIWIGTTSYMGNWMISVIGDTIGIPESVMGMTFLAAGGSMPEAISTVIMARQGEGGLGFSNSLGGNTINICLCLGLPWLLKCSLNGPIEIDSESLQYNSIALFIGVFVLVTVSLHTKFNMNRRMGVICGVCYVIFVVVSALFELGAIPS